MTFKVAVLASTRGTDLQAIIDESEAGLMPGVEIVRVVSNMRGCGALEKARAHGIEDVFVGPKKVDGSKKTREEFDADLVEAVRGSAAGGNVDLVCLIGYMRILTPVFVKAFEGQIINVHPALLPKYGGPGFFGANVHEAVLASDEEETGMTIHYVTEEVDGGPILLQKTTLIDDGDTPDDLKEKVQGLEKKWYPEAIRLIYKEKMANLDGHLES
jgi:phosphoribosylglycinamide formyltransferase 1